jgi:hypothetical protein
MALALSVRPVERRAIILFAVPREELFDTGAQAFGLRGEVGSTGVD